MANIEKLQRAQGPVYKAVVRRKGHGKISKTFKARSAAERWGRKLEAQIDEGNAGLITEGQQHTLSDAISRYRAEFLPKLRPETVRKYEQHLDYWQPQLGHLRLSELTAAKIAEHRDLLAGTPIPSKAKDADKAGPPRDRSPATVNRHLATLGAVLTACVKKLHWLQVSPLQQVAKGSEHNAGTRYLSEDELQRLLEIGNVLGHKSANTTKRYAHLSEQHTRALVRGMADGLLGTAGGEG